MQKEKCLFFSHLFYSLLSVFKEIELRKLKKKLIDPNWRSAKTRIIIKHLKETRLQSVFLEKL
jgi:hypothetical protein